MHSGGNICCFCVKFQILSRIFFIFVFSCLHQFEFTPIGPYSKAQKRQHRNILSQKLSAEFVHYSEKKKIFLSRGLKNKFSVFSAFFTWPGQDHLNRISMQNQILISILRKKSCLQSRSDY